MRTERAFRLPRLLKLIFLIYWNQPSHHSIGLALWNLIKWLLLWPLANLITFCVYVGFGSLWTDWTYPWLKAPYAKSVIELFSFMSALKSSAFRQFCITERVMWVGFHQTHRLEMVYAFFQGSRIPLVLRRRQTGYQLAGKCYLHGLMMDDPQKLEHTQSTTISLMLTAIMNLISDPP